jgi:aspartyl-tRNA(Asn)/glutamyl-tRNA(Gln) amidotransferase subunit C
MNISPDDVRHIARLARLDLTDEEVERLGHELSTILAYVEQLETLEAGLAGELSAPDQPLRRDEIENYEDLELLHGEAPDFVDDFFRVPRVIE